MLITFSCEEYENITMFGDVAKRLLTLMGHSATVPGAIKAADIPKALSCLKQGLQQEQPATKNQQDDEEDEPISLAHRAIPLIGMLETAAKTEKNILWS
ncbi:MAG: DUF1840 domain-containing protein [Tatlockia sp.]|nr:DUF1840 domain-containing protein [Tatlockia sp.]